MGGRAGRRQIVPRSESFRSVAYLMLLPIGGLSLFFLWNFLHGGASPIPILKNAIPRTAVVKPAAAVQQSIVQQSIVAARHRGDIVLILDDVGFDHQPVTGAMSIDPNVNFAILPNAQNADTVARRLHAGGFEVLCHLPMEPEGFPAVSPGEGAVLTSMSDGEIARATRANVSSIPFARGVNNHMGSRATADRRVMTGVLTALPEGMYFIDSKTASGSLGSSLARQLHVKTASRSIFLDDVQKDDAIRKQLQSLSESAEAHGVAVGIGHMYPSTVRVLTEEAPGLRARGWRFVRASAVVR